MEGGWEGWDGDGGAPYDVAEPSHHMTALADEAIPPALVPGATALLPLSPGGLSGAAPGTVALSDLEDEVSSGRWRGWLSPSAPSPPRARAALPAGAREWRRDECGAVSLRAGPTGLPGLPRTG